MFEFFHEENTESIKRLGNEVSCMSWHRVEEVDSLAMSGSTREDFEEVYIPSWF